MHWNNEAYVLLPKQEVGAGTRIKSCHSSLWGLGSGNTRDWGSGCTQSWRLWQITTFYEALTKSHLLLQDEGVWKPFLCWRCCLNPYANIRQRCSVRFHSPHSRCKGCVRQLCRCTKGHFEARLRTTVFTHCPPQMPMGKIKRQSGESHLYLWRRWLPCRQCPAQSPKVVWSLHIREPDNPSLLFRCSQ
jgi:hypothetical protein